MKFHDVTGCHRSTQTRLQNSRYFSAQFAARKGAKRRERDTLRFHTRSRPFIRRPRVVTQKIRLFCSLVRNRRETFLETTVTENLRDQLPRPQVSLLGRARGVVGSPPNHQAPRSLFSRPLPTKCQVKRRRDRSLYMLFRKIFGGLRQFANVEKDVLSVNDTSFSGGNFFPSSLCH